MDNLKMAEKPLLDGAVVKYLKKALVKTKKDLSGGINKNKVGLLGKIWKQF